jgi:hypothetical protein
MKRTGSPNQGTTDGPSAPTAFHLGDLSSYSTDNGLAEPAAKKDFLTDPFVRPYVADLPNFRLINQISIVEVAARIGWRVEDGKIICPQSAEHDAGTSQAIRLLPSSNKVICDACDTYPMTVLDMVQDFGGFGELSDAAEYISCHYPNAPRKSKASYLKNPTGEHVPPGCRNPWTLLITSGIWSDLSVPSQRLIPVFLQRSNWRDDEECVFHFSNRAMMRYSGIGTFTGISEALAELKAIGWLERLPVRQRERSPEREIAGYRLTPLSQRLRKFADATATKFGATIFQEKAIARRKRQERERKRQFPSLDTLKV